MLRLLTRIMSFSTKTDRSSEMRRTLQIRIRALNRNRYLSLHFPSLSDTVNQSWNQNTKIRYTKAKYFILWYQHLIGTCNFRSSLRQTANRHIFKWQWQNYESVNKQILYKKEKFKKYWKKALTGSHNTTKYQSWRRLL